MSCFQVWWTILSLGCWREKIPWRPEGDQVLWCQRQHQVPSVLRKSSRRAGLLYWSCEKGQTHSVTMEGGQAVQPAGRAQNWAQWDNSSATISPKTKHQFLCPSAPSHLTYAESRSPGGWGSMPAGAFLCPCAMVESDFLQLQQQELWVSTSHHFSPPTLQWGAQTTFSPTRLEVVTWICTGSLQHHLGLS